MAFKAKKARRAAAEIFSVPEDENLLAITFDDGFRDNLTVALPLLEKYNLPATVFVTADFIGKENYLSTEELQTLASHPLITIGSHSFRASSFDFTFGR